MKRDAVDLNEILPAHWEVHQRLENWARWCRSSGGGSAVLPMFQGYRDKYHETKPAPVPVDSLDGHRIEKAVTALPEKHRACLQWSYVRPYIPVHKVRRVLGLTTPGLHELLHDSRTMLKNRLAR